MSSSDFNTPPEFLARVRQLHPEGIGLDPCSNATSLVGARTSYTLDTSCLGAPGHHIMDGLKPSWLGHGLVFVNPPHSPSPHNIEPWMRKARELLGLLTLGNEQDALLMLVPAKTGPVWFQQEAVRFSWKCFVAGRIVFWENGSRTTGPGKFDSLVLYAGPHGRRRHQWEPATTFRDVFESIGWVP